MPPDEYSLAAERTSSLQPFVSSAPVVVHELATVTSDERPLIVRPPTGLPDESVALITTAGISVALIRFARSR